MWRLCDLVEQCGGVWSRVDECGRLIGHCGQLEGDGRGGGGQWRSKKDSG